MSTVNLKPQLEWIVTFLKGKGWVSPTEIGQRYGQAFNRPNLHSSWASPKCKKLAEIGLLERCELKGRIGYYRVKPEKN